MAELEFFELSQRMAVALAIGVLIGLERGWHGRDEAEGQRVAGMRTFALIGLLGAGSSLLALQLGEIFLGFAFASVAAVMTLFRLRAAAETKDYGATTIIAGLLTFALGALAMRGELGLAASVGVVAALLLGVKPGLHRLLLKIDYEELLAVLKLLAMSVVLLPVLPNRGYGPWQMLNTYEVWLMVVLICSISFVGYLGIRISV